MRNTVNKFMVKSLLDPLGGSADMDDNDSMKLLSVDGDNEEQVKRVISDHILPYFNLKSNEYKASAKRSLNYFLHTKSADFGYLYDSCLIAFDHPQNPIQFFVWLWEVLFPLESLHLTESFDVEEISDPSEPNSYL